MKRSVLTLTVLTILVVAVPVFAASTPTTFTVSASVINNCTISAGNLAFGSYDPVVANNTTGADLYANSTLTVACTKGASNVWIGLDAGANGASAVGTTRAMSAGGGNFLSYELYTANPNPAPGTAWGNTQATGASYTPVSKAAASITVYGRTPKGQDAAAGAYSDTITATINY
jgi:spore coat protein U domain-containing protein, fimbrial subunit CupE1/2/3/6